MVEQTEVLAGGGRVLQAVVTLRRSGNPTSDNTGWEFFIPSTWIKEGLVPQGGWYYSAIKSHPGAGVEHPSSLGMVPLAGRAGKSGKRPGERLNRAKVTYQRNGQGRVRIWYHKETALFMETQLNLTGSSQNVGLILTDYGALILIRIPEHATEVGPEEN